MSPTRPRALRAERAVFRKVFRRLESRGLLLESDAELPSVTSLVIGSPIRGSWWGHPRGREIFRVMVQLAARPDVIPTKLVSDKVTFVHRGLWPALLAVATSGEPWQFAGISSAARSLLKEVLRQGSLRTDRLADMRRREGKTIGASARELERRLLVYSEQVHTESGAHAKQLESWDHWAQRRQVAAAPIAVQRAKELLEQAVRSFAQRARAAAQLPWQVK